MRWRLDVRWWFHGFVVFPNEVYHRTFDEGRAVERERLRGVLSHAVHLRAMDRAFIGGAHSSSEGSVAQLPFFITAVHRDPWPTTGASVESSN